MEIFKGYRLTYVFSFIVIAILVSIALSSKIQKGNPPDAINTISIIGTALTLFGIIITIVEIYGINSISKLTKQAAEKAVKDVKENIRISKMLELKHRLDLIRTNFLNDEYGISWTHLTEIKNSINDISDENDKKNTESLHNILLDQLENWKNKFELKINSKKTFSPQEKKKFIEFLSKINVLINH